MRDITIQKLLESNKTKVEACEKCKEQLSKYLTEEQLGLFEKIFYEVSADYLFRIDNNM